MNFEQLSQEYQDDVLAEALFSREQEFFHYAVDRKNYEAILESLAPGEYRSRIEGLLAATIAEQEKVDALFRALKTQISNPEAHALAVSRTAAKRNAKG